MKKIFVLVLLFISTSYLFSQPDTSVVEVSPKKEGVMFSARAGIGTLLVGGSVAVDFPVIDTIIYKLNISSQFYVDISGGAVFGLGLGYVPIKTKTNNFILKLNLRPSIVTSKRDVRYCLNIGTDFIYKSIFISPDIFVLAIDNSNRIGALFMLFFGINHKY